MFYEYVSFVENWSTMLIFFSLASLTMALALSPTTFVALASGFFFGWNGLWGIFLSYPIAALIGRELGKWILTRNVQTSWLNHDAFDTVLEQLGQHPFRLLVFMRLSPVLPFAMSNLLLAQVNIPMRTYLLGTMAGMLPRSLFALWLGSQAPSYLQLFSTNDSAVNQFSTWLTITLLLISTGGLLFLSRKAAKLLVPKNS